MIEYNDVIAFETAAKRLPNENYSNDKKLNDWSLDSVIKSPKYKDREGLVLNSDSLELNIYMAALLGYYPATLEQSFSYTATDKESRLDWRKKITERSYEIVTRLFNKEYHDFEEFWNVFSKEAQEFRDYSHSLGEIDFTFGNAQKWLNMTIKHLYSLLRLNHKGLDKYANADIFKVGTFAVDQGIMNVVEEKLNIDFHNYTTEKFWSKVDDSNAFYKYYKAIMEVIGTNLFEFEYLNWKAPNK